MTSTSGGLNESNLDESKNVAVDFQRELNSILETRPPISKDKMNHIVKEALKEIRHYKHVVYYVESFIKNCSPEYKIPGLYVIDAIIRNSKSQSSNHKEVYANRFSKNMCKTFSNLYSKCPDSDREKITRVLQLWQKYNILDGELIDKLNRISSLASIDCAINNNSQQQTDQVNREPSDADKLKRLNYLQHKLAKLQEQQKHSNKVIIDDKLISEIHKLSSQLLNVKKPTDTPPITTKTEINKILDFENDLDSESDNNNKSLNDNESTSTNEYNSKMKRKSSTSSNVVFNEDTLNSSERFKKSIDNCAAWLKTTVNAPDQQQQQQPKILSSQESKKINLPDLSQPPPPLLINYNKDNLQHQQFSYQFPQSNSSSVDSILLSASKRLKTSTPPPPPLPPLPPSVPPPPPPTSSKLESHNFDTRQLAREKERDRSRRGLPNIREKHICICSKTLWLGHLTKTTTEDYVIDELTELLSPSSSNDDSQRKIEKNNKSNNIIVDCQLIPPRGCAYVEFVDRKTASKCLERMKDGYRLDGNSIKVAWATNKGINKDRQIKLYWNVEVGCTYVPWSDLDLIPSVDFIKWAEGGLIDEDSIPDKYLALFKKQMLQLANSDTSNSKNDLDHSKSQVHDMDLDTEDDNQITNQTNLQFQSSIQPQGLHLPPPPLPLPPAQLAQLLPNQSIQIPPHLLNSDLLNHLRSNQLPPPPHGADPNLQLQFLSGLNNTQTAQLPDIQSALAHFQHLNSQSQSTTNSNQTSQLNNRLNQQSPQNQPNPQRSTNNNLVFTTTTTQPNSTPGQHQVLLTNTIPFADLLQRNSQHNQHQQPTSQIQNPLQLIQPQLLAGNTPFTPQHFQLIQRPFLISPRQGATPAGLTSLTNLLSNPNQSQLHLLSSMQSQQQQQRLNLQMRNILASVAAPGLAPANQAANNPASFFLPNNTKLPQMIFLNEQFHQDLNQPVVQQQQLVTQPTTTKSPTVTSTTELNGQSINQQNSSGNNETTSHSPPNPKPLMDIILNEKNNDTSLDVKNSEPKTLEANEDKSNTNESFYNKNLSSYDRFSNNNNSNSWRGNSRRSNGSRIYDYHNTNNNKSNKNWHQSNWQQSKRNFNSYDDDNYKRANPSSYSNKSNKHELEKQELSNHQNSDSNNTNHDHHTNDEEKNPIKNE